MFEHFTFGATPQTRHLDEAFPSPTDTSFPSPLSPPPTSFPFYSNQHQHQQSELNDFVAKFSQQTLQQRSREELVKRFQTWRNESPEGLEVDDEEMHPSEQRVVTASLPPTPTVADVSCRRLQRQLNMQMQSSETHVKDINALVEDMISSNEQCRITSRTPLSPPPSRGGDMKLVVDPASQFEDEMIGVGDIDEGFCDGEPDEEEELEMTLRRASAPNGIRKYDLRYGRSADIVHIAGRPMVRNLPRLRKRKVQLSMRAEPMRD